MRFGRAGQTHYGMGGGQSSVIVRPAAPAPASSLLTGLVAYWALEEASGSTRLDATGRRNHLSPTGVALAVAGRIGQGLYCGSGSYVSRASTPDLQGGDSAFTVAGWFYPLSLSDVRPLLGKWGGTACEYFLILNAGTWQWYVSSTGSDSVHVDGGSATLEAWHCVVAWHDPVTDVIGLQVNNGTPLTTSHSLGVYAGAASFALGHNPNNIDPADAVPDEIGVWRRLLTSAERSLLFNSGAGRTHPFA